MIHLHFSGAFRSYIIIGKSIITLNEKPARRRVFIEIYSWALRGRIGQIIFDYGRRYKDNQIAV